MTSPLATRPLWSYPHQHRFTKSQQRSVVDTIGSYGYRWGLRPVAPFHEVKRARHAAHTDSGYNGWELLYAEILPVRRLVHDLENVKGGAFLSHWFALRDAGFRPIVEDADTRWSFRVDSVPLDYLHAVEPLPIRRGIAAISRWTWCRGCDAELAVTRQGWCESCAVAPVAESPEYRPIGAPLHYVPEVGP